MTTTQLRTTRTTLAALAMAAAAVLTLGPATPAHAQRSDTGSRQVQLTARSTAVDQVVALRRSQQAQYVVDHGLVSRR